MQKYRSSVSLFFVFVSFNLFTIPVQCAVDVSCFVSLPALFLTLHVSFSLPLCLRSCPWLCCTTIFYIFYFSVIFCNPIFWMHRLEVADERWMETKIIAKQKKKEMFEKTMFEMNGKLRAFPAVFLHLTRNKWKIKIRFQCLFNSCVIVKYNFLHTKLPCECVIFCSLPLRFVSRFCCYFYSIFSFVFSLAFSNFLFFFFHPFLGFFFSHLPQQNNAFENENYSIVGFEERNIVKNREKKNANISCVTARD